MLGIFTSKEVQDKLAAYPHFFVVCVCKFLVQDLAERGIDSSETGSGSVCGVRLRLW